MDAQPAFLWQASQRIAPRERRVTTQLPLREVPMPRFAGRRCEAKPSARSQGTP